MKTPDWFKIKKYPNIGNPITIKDTRKVVKYVTNPSAIAKHKFYPLIHRVVKQRKYRPSKNALKNQYGKRTRTVQNPKIRHIYYPTHIDSLVYSYYASILNDYYETYLLDKPYSNCPVAYRKISVEGKSYNKSNIEFAYEAFKFMLDCDYDSITVFVADVSSFFDNLDHRILHKQWKKVLDVCDMPQDHYTLFKNLTSFSYVDEVQIYTRFRHKLIVERHKPHDVNSTTYKRKKVNKIWNLKREQVVAYCTSNEFYSEAKDLIRSDKPANNEVRRRRGKKEKKGIPQGTPISAVLANIYMIDFDENVYKEASSKGAFYQRYSDDIIIICNRVDEDFFKKLLHHEIKESSKLEIQPQKTRTYHYNRESEQVLNGGEYLDFKINSNCQLEYLGFRFDGKKVRVKTSALSKFYRNMKRSFRRGVHFAKSKHINSNDLYERKLYDRYTHYGAKRRVKFIEDPSRKGGYKMSKYYVWGNLFSYMQKANLIMKAINNDDSILNQIRKVWKNFHKIKKASYDEINKERFGG